MKRKEKKNAKKIKFKNRDKNRKKDKCNLSVCSRENLIELHSLYTLYRVNVQCSTFIKREKEREKGEIEREIWCEKRRKKGSGEPGKRKCERKRKWDSVRERES